MRLKGKIRALERGTRAMFPPRPEPTLRDLARHDHEVLRMLCDLRQWKDDHPGEDEMGDPKCRADLEEMTRRYEAFVKAPPKGVRR